MALAGPSQVSPAIPELSGRKAWHHVSGHVPWVGLYHLYPDMSYICLPQTPKGRGHSEMVMGVRTVCPALPSVSSSWGPVTPLFCCTPSVGCQFRYSAFIHSAHTECPWVPGAVWALRLSSEQGSLLFSLVGESDGT